MQNQALLERAFCVIMLFLVAKCVIWIKKGNYINFLSNKRSLHKIIINPYGNGQFSNKICGQEIQGPEHVFQLFASWHLALFYNTFRLNPLLCCIEFRNHPAFGAKYI
jgi:hypothetical protein